MVSVWVGLVIVNNYNHTAGRGLFPLTLRCFEHGSNIQTKKKYKEHTHNKAYEKKNEHKIAVIKPTIIYINKHVFYIEIRIQFVRVTAGSY